MFRSPKIPETRTAPPPLPAITANANLAAQNQPLVSAPRGASSLISTGPQGLTTRARTRKRTLLGAS